MNISYHTIPEISGFFLVIIYYYKFPKVINFGTSEKSCNHVIFMENNNIKFKFSIVSIRYCIK